MICDLGHGYPERWNKPQKSLKPETSHQSVSTEEVSWIGGETSSGTKNKLSCLDLNTELMYYTDHVCKK